jgi:hypothetical protein
VLLLCVSTPFLEISFTLILSLLLQFHCVSSLLYPQRMSGFNLAFCLFHPAKFVDSFLCEFGKCYPYVFVARSLQIHGWILCDLGDNIPMFLLGAPSEIVVSTLYVLGVITSTFYLFLRQNFCCYLLRFPQESVSQLTHSFLVWYCRKF